MKKNDKGVMKKIIKNTIKAKKSKFLFLSQNIGYKIEKIKDLRFGNKSFIATTDDPFIKISLPNGHKFFEISFDIESNIENSIIQLFFKYTDKYDFQEKNSILLGSHSDKRKTIHLHLPIPTRHFRIDLSDRKGKFVLNRFNIKQISRIEFYLKTKKYKKFSSVIQYIAQDPKLIYKFLKTLKTEGIKTAVKKIVYYKSQEPQINVNALTKVNTVLNAYQQRYNNTLKTRKPIYIIIPIYNGYEYLQPLFNSIKDNTKIPYKLIVINDKSPDKRVKPLLDKIKKEFKYFRLIENKENLGFVKNINKAVKYVDNHFVLLNSDVEVPPNWLERLIWPIENLKRIASTTPVTNAGTIASFPQMLKNNELFNNMSVNEIDSYFKKINPSSLYLEAPTGIGFCMGINYEVYKKIGMFDEIFGLGYGEENDWSQRAVQAGYKNLLIPNLFVYHKETSSFTKKEKEKLINSNLKIIGKRYPNYFKDVERIVTQDDWKYFRYIMIILLSKNFYLTFHHEIGGGATIYLNKLINKKVKENKNVLNISFSGKTNLFYLNFVSKDFNFRLPFQNFNILTALLDLINIETIFVNNLVSYPNIFEVLDWINRQKTKIIIPVHDFFCICPKFTLLNYKGVYCGVPDNLETCDKCLEKSRKDIEQYIPIGTKLDIRTWRKKWLNTLMKAEEILTFSNNSKRIIQKAYPNLDSKKVKVVPHKVDYIEPIDKKLTKIKNIGIIGNINYQKGSKIIKDIVKVLKSKKLDYKIILIGQLLNNKFKPDTKYFYQTGPFKKEDLPRLTKQYDIDIFLIPSIWPETFSFTTEEIIKMGMPILVFNIGAPAERVKKYKKGYIIDKIDASSVIKKIEEIKQLLIK